MESLSINLGAIPCTLLLSTTSILVQPTADALPSSSPSELPLADIAFVREDSAGEGVIKVDVVYLESLSTPDNLPSVKSLTFETLKADFDAWTAVHPPLLELLLGNSSLKRHVDIILNPSAGGGRAGSFCKRVVVPLLEFASVSSRVLESQGVDDAGRIARELVQEDRVAGIERAVAVLGGDGTTHEILNGVLLPSSVADSTHSLNLILL